MAMGGYSSPAYLKSLSNFGEPIWLLRSEAGLLIQSIPGAGRTDARGPYPFLSCRRWPELLADLSQLTADWVSLTAVIDPGANPGSEVLECAFPDLCRPFKAHAWVDLENGFSGPISSHHRRQVRRAASRLEVERLDEPIKALEDWWRLYEGLIGRHSINGIARFSRGAFESQLQMPELRGYRAWHGTQTAGMVLWLVDGDHATYHLGAASELGYQTGAMYALFDFALRDFAAEGLRSANLGGGAGREVHPEDGLARFKFGWTEGVRTAWIGGRILDHPAYDRLSNGLATGFFPAYRDSVATRPVAA